MTGFFKKIDWALFLPVLFLCFFGLAAIYSVALGQGQGGFLNFQKQIIWLAISLVLMFFLSRLDYRLWRKIGWIGYGISLLLLILVLTPLGASIRGSRGWFDFGFLSFQPVELAKVFIIIVLADVYSRYGRSIHKLASLLFLSLIVLLPLVLVVIQPDFGSAMILFFTWLISFFLVTKNKWHFAVIIGGLAAILMISWLFVFQDYQKDRLLTFVNPSLDPLGRGYNMRQSIIAVGAGRIFGRGLGFGSQSQLKFIPESQTDFIFSVIAEELGLVGVLFLLIFFALIFFRLFRIASRSPDDFGLFVALLVLILFFVQVFINIGMSVGLLPVTGISLPLVSYGGSFLLVVLALLGIVMNIYQASLVSRKYRGDI